MCNNDESIIIHIFIVFVLQQALRLIAYRNIHKVLGIEKISEPLPNARKRPNDGGNENGNKMSKHEASM